MALKDIQIQNFFDRKKVKLNIEVISSAKNEEVVSQKVEPKWSQNETIHTFNQSQTRAKREPKWGHTSIQPEPNQSQTRAKVEPQLELQSETKWSHIDENESFSQLVGLQKMIIICIYENCTLSRSNESQKLTISFISSYCNTTKASIKKAIQRLVKKNVLIRKSFKDGRSGWTTYVLPNNIYYEIIHTKEGIKNEIKYSQSGAKVEPQRESQPEPSIASSSSDYILYKTTTDGGKNINHLLHQLPIEWQSLDLEPLSNTGFTKNHLSQIASQNKLTAQIVQDSIYAFAFDLLENDKIKKIKGDPINFFMGILRNGKPYTPPSNYESPQDKAIRIYSERMQEIEQKRVAAEKEAIRLAFNEWFTKLTDEQKIELLPDMLRRNMNNEKLGKSKILESSARNHYEKEVWPNEKKKIIETKCVDNKF